MRTGLLVVLGCAVASVGCAAQQKAVEESASGMAVEIRASGDSALEVMIGGKPFTTYHNSKDEKKPYLWPVLGEDGVPLTRAWPMGESEGKKDHPHHKSLWTAYGDCNDADCWGEGGNSGRQVSGEVTSGQGDGFGWIKADNTWVNSEDKPVLNESREYRFYPGEPACRIVDVTVTFTAADGDVLFEDTKEGGIVAVRVREQIQADQGGTITNAEGLHGERECWGKPSRWCDYSGEFEDGKVRGIAVFDHPSNLRHPSRWHVRNYGLMGANCFGLSYFTKNEDEQLNGDYTLKAGETLTFQYRVVAHSGTAEEAKLNDLYADYAAGK
jgi:hypothetical protein